MASSSVIKSCKHLDPKEEHIIDLDIGITETFLTLENITKIKSKLSQIPNLISASLCSPLFDVKI